MRHGLLVGAMAAGAMAQAEFAKPGFKYVGCADTSAISLPNNPTLEEGAGPKDCQDKCDDSRYVGYGGGCFCSDKDNQPEQDLAKVIVDDSNCGVADGSYVELYQKLVKVEAYIDCPPDVKDCHNWDGHTGHHGPPPPPPPPGWGNKPWPNPEDCDEYGNPLPGKYPPGPPGPPGQRPPPPPGHGGYPGDEDCDEVSGGSWSYSWSCEGSNCHNWSCDGDDCFKGWECKSGDCGKEGGHWHCEGDNCHDGWSCHGDGCDDGHNGGKWDWSCECQGEGDHGDHGDNWGCHAPCVGDHCHGPAPHPEPPVYDCDPKDPNCHGHDGYDHGYDHGMDHGYDNGKDHGHGSFWDYTCDGDKCHEGWSCNGEHCDMEGGNGHHWHYEGDAEHCYEPCIGDNCGNNGGWKCDGDYCQEWSCKGDSCFKNWNCECDQGECEGPYPQPPVYPDCDEHDVNCHKPQPPVQPECDEHDENCNKPPVPECDEHDENCNKPQPPVQPECDEHDENCNKPHPEPPVYPECDENNGDCKKPGNEGEEYCEYICSGEHCHEGGWACEGDHCAETCTDDCELHWHCSGDSCVEPCVGDHCKEHWTCSGFDCHEWHCSGEHCFDSWNCEGDKCPVKVAPPPPNNGTNVNIHKPECNGDDCIPPPVHVGAGAQLVAGTTAFGIVTAAIAFALM